MADKTIGALEAAPIGGLPGIAELYDDTLIPVEQQGEARKMTGAQWKAYAQQSVGGGGSADLSNVITIPGGAHITLVGDFGRPPYEIVITPSGISVSGSHTVALSVDPAGGGTVSGGGTYQHGSSVTVTASPASGYDLVGWERDGTVVSSSASYTFTVDSDTELTAVFSKVSAALGEWKEATLPYTANWCSIAFGADKFVAVASDLGKAIYSQNGEQWEAADLPLSEGWEAVVCGESRFFAVAFDSSIAAYTYNSDGTKWGESALLRGKWRDVAYGDGKYVIVGENSLSLHSYDAVAWEYANMPSERNWYKIAYGNGIFVAIALTGGDVAYSEDGGKTWKEASLPVSANFSGSIMCMEYANGGFYAIEYGESNAYYSENGRDWSLLTLPTFSRYWISAAYGNGKFLLLPDSSTKAAYTENFASWTESLLPRSANWGSVAHGNNRFVALPNGGNKAIYTDT